MTLGWIYRGGLLTQWPMVNDRRRLSRHKGKAKAQSIVFSKYRL